MPPRSTPQATRKAAPRKISQVRTPAATGRRFKPGSFNPGSAADTLAARTRAQLDAIAEQTAAVLSQARESRLAGECARLEQAATDLERLGQDTADRVRSVAEFLDAATAARLEADERRMAESFEAMKARLAAVAALRDQTHELLASFGWRNSA